MTSPLPFTSVARLCAPGDNAAIAIRPLPAGTSVQGPTGPFALPLPLLEGHRFPWQAVRAGEPLLSWGLPFGRALRDLAPGEWLCNRMILDGLQGRDTGFALPPVPNFQDHRQDFELDEGTFQPAPPLEPAPHPGTFQGYPRPGGRGSGTRNFIVLLGTSSRTGAVVRRLARQWNLRAADWPGLDGIVPVAHTEGGGLTVPLNLEMSLRTLAGFVVHPNTAAVLLVDEGGEWLNNQSLTAWARDHDLPIEAVPHHALSLDQGVEQALAHAAERLATWVPMVGRQERSPCPLSDLKIALQCGGSDAFSGVSGNPLSGAVARLLLQHGGSANLAETSELIGAEAYVLNRVRNLETARDFLRVRDRFQEWAGWHGHSAEGNPSGGNLFRGLYNIAIKSIGAARKKDPDVPLDFVIDYGAPMREPGYYFMDSPGNDLESIAGQVAGGCNLIHFITGNGSITNFPFVPTLKIVTTTGRFELLSREMDVNAGRYLDGEPLESLARETFDLSVEVASGRTTAGERAGHSQVQLWRAWRQPDASRLATVQSEPEWSGKPVPMGRLFEPLNGTLQLFRGPQGCSGRQTCLILPTSLCAGEIARGIARELDADQRAVQEISGVPGPGFAALPHTEGCGAARGTAETLFLRTLTAHLHHPSVRHTLLLEHGCEKTHNDEVRRFLQALGWDDSAVGRASIQMDGGIEQVTAKVKAWFHDRISRDLPAPRVSVGPDEVRLALLPVEPLPGFVAPILGQFIGRLCAARAQVLLPAGCDLLRRPAWRETLGWTSDLAVNLGFGQTVEQAGLHLMDTPTNDPLEWQTGLVACGADSVVVVTAQPDPAGHPLVPVIHLQPVASGTTLSRETDLLLAPDSTPDTLWSDLVPFITGSRIPLCGVSHETAFQITRGEVGVSL